MKLKMGRLFATESSLKKFVINAQMNEIINPYYLKEMFELDFSERSTVEHALSQEERKFLARVTENIRHLEDRHYEMPLPLKDPNTKLPNNREMALHRLKHLKRRFIADERHRNDYGRFMDMVIQNGYGSDPLDSSRESSLALQEPFACFTY